MVGVSTGMTLWACQLFHHTLVQLPSAAIQPHLQLLWAASVRMYLRSHPDQRFVQYVFQGISKGFQIGAMGNIEIQSSLAFTPL